MPRFIGQTIAGATRIENNANPCFARVRLSYSQAALLPASEIMCSLDTTDRGSRGTKAKQWYRWFAHPVAILSSPKATARMRAAALAAAPDALHRVAIESLGVPA